MGVFSGPLKSSANAGQLSKDLQGKVGIKQYYNGAKVMKGFEPIPQAGFDLLPGSAYVGAGLSARCRKTVLSVDADRSYTLIFTAGKATIFRNDRVNVATVNVPEISEAILPELSFYGEANTVGIFHPSLPSGLRLLRNASNDAIWSVSSWPFENVPMVDLGGSYAQTDDKWVLTIRWASTVTSLLLSCTVESNDTAAVQLVRSGSPISPTAASAGDWDNFATLIQGAIAAIGGFASGVSVFRSRLDTNFIEFGVTFGGVLKGDEYGFDAQVVNTSEASALVSHTQVGKTDGEGLISSARGGFAGMELYQDRGVYYAPAARKAAVSMSKVGEYFDLNIDNQADSGARLEALRSTTSEVIRHVLDNTYLLVFTDKAEWFASSRTVKRNEPMNWVRASEIGSRKNCRPVVLENNVYFVSPDGGIMYSVSYDAVSTTYVPKSENDLNKDLITGVMRQAVQRKPGIDTVQRQWILRDDGRLVCAVINKTQEIMAACEWPVVGGGLVKDIVVDGQQQVWITVDRGGAISEEVLEEASANLFQSSLTVTSDLAGQATGLAIFNGKTVWVEAQGDVFGPYQVSAGAIQTELPTTSMKIGIWSPPVYEAMPFAKVLPDDTVVRRPGAVKAVKLYLLDADSIAIGANGLPARNVSLNRASDDLTLPAQGFTGHVTVTGLKGACMDPTLVITQLRPGRLRVRDYIPGVKL